MSQSSLEHSSPGTFERATRFRWVICGLLFYATTLNYMDRSVLNVLQPRLKTEFHFTDAQYGNINAAFSAAYTLGFLVMGWLIDRLGTRAGYAISLVLWSAAGACTALVNSTMGLGIARSCLALGESGNFPAAIKTVAEWFPRRQRATATGIFNSGSNVGAILAFWLVPLVIGWAGNSWRVAFLITPIFAVVWIVLWLIIYRSPEKHPRVNEAELAHINSDGAVATQAKVRWGQIFPHRQTWAIMLGKFFTDPVWWFYLFWSGAFIHDKFGGDIKHLGPPLIVIYFFSSFGSIIGGWLSSKLIDSGWSTNAARKTAMLICCLAVVPVSLAPAMHTMWPAVLLIAVAAAAHQGFSANIFTLTSDMFEKSAVGSVVGLAGLCGGIGSIILQFAAGRIIQASGYQIPFIILAAVYVLAFICLHALAPNLTPVNLSGPEPRGFEVVQ